ncbi:MAG: YdeI/OmpD-associated family protein [Chitinophagaceae bacterium]|jgi:hypothetical protein|nr:YdeI/OmpD-associated family protein [Chitinophagaceae bacterium]
MVNHSLFEKLNFVDERNILIQGLPSSIEKQFAKLSYSKDVTPLLKTRKIDFALVFAINNAQLCYILKDVFPALHIKSKLWIAYPKSASKIASDLNRQNTWLVLQNNGYISDEEVVLDHVWAAIFFKRTEITSIEMVRNAMPDTMNESAMERSARSFEKRLSVLPEELASLFGKHKKAKEFFSSLPSVNQKEYVTWIEGAKRIDTKQRRLEATLEKLLSGKKNPMEK